MARKACARSPFCRSRGQSLALSETRNIRSIIAVNTNQNHATPSRMMTCEDSLGPDKQERQMSKTVADVLVGVLEQVGVKQIFGLISDSLNPLADAVRRSGIEWVGVRHEEGAALAAAGQAKLTGQLAVCAGTTGPGSNHLVAGLYEASRDHAPG